MIESRKKIKERSIYSSISLIPFGIIVNYLPSQLVLALHVPLFIDSLGTVLTTLFGGFIPGMFVGFLLNLIGGISDPITLYYGLISMLLALATGALAKRGWFDSLKRAWLPILVFTFIGGFLGSCLTWFLYGKGIGTGISAPFARELLELGIPSFIAQLIADVVIDFADKTLTVFLVIAVVKMLPEKMILYLPYRLIYRKENSSANNYRRISLKTKMILVLTINALFVGGAATIIDAFTYRKDMISQHTCIQTGIVDMTIVNQNLMIYVIKHVSLLFGIALVAAMITLVYCDLHIVDPINRMTASADMFAFNNEEKKKEAERLLYETNIHTGDELETMLISLKKMASDTNAYIEHINHDIAYISKLQDGMILSFADMVENRDCNTGEHIKRTAAYVEIIARTLQKEGKYKEILTEPYIANLVRSAPLHDIGKIRISDSILNKPGRLTDEEFALMKTHTSIGKEMLERVSENVGASEYFSIAEQMAFGHHEWWNGTGYPRGVKREEIPLSARIMAVADVYDALISKRSYKDAFDQDKAFAIIQEEAGTHFDPVIVDAFVSVKDEICKIVQE